MKNKIKILLGTLLVIAVLFGCNVYSPLTSPSIEEEYIEQAQKCLHDGDYACALEQYSLLSDGAKKSEKLCIVNMARAGFTLSVLIDIASNRTSGSNMVGLMANRLIPWSQEKQNAVVTAVTHCNALATQNPTGKIAVLLKSLGLLMDCSVRMAKADMLIGSSLTDTACTTAGNNNGRVTSSDMSQSSDGSGSGMCAADVTQCLADFSAVPSTQLADAGLSDLKANYDAMPAALKTTSTGTQVGRAQLKNTVSAD